MATGPQRESFLRREIETYTTPPAGVDPAWAARIVRAARLELGLPVEPESPAPARVLTDEERAASDREEARMGRILRAASRRGDL